MTAGKTRLKRGDMEAASAWLARLHADDCGEEDRRDFSSWLDASDGHRGAFEAVTMAFEAAGAAADYRPQLEQASRDRPAVPRRAILAGAGVLAAGASLAGWQAAFAGTVRTGFAERRMLRLDDGSTVQMDAETQLREPWLRSRALELSAGRISVQARRDASADFVISTNRHRITGNGMDADVALDDGRLTVCVASGEVVVAAGDAPGVRLRAGERIVRDGTIDRPEMDVLLAWRQGRLHFADTPLSEACTQLNRYDRVRLVPDAQAGALRISGTFQMGRNADFARAMTELLRVRTTIRGDRIDMNGTAERAE